MRLVRLLLLVALAGSAVAHAENSLVEQGRLLDALKFSQADVDASIQAHGIDSFETHTALAEYAKVSRASSEVETAWFLSRALLQAGKLEHSPRLQAEMNVLAAKSGWDIERGAVRGYLDRAIEILKPIQPKHADLWADILQFEGFMMRRKDGDTARAFYQRAVDVRRQYCPRPRWSLAQGLVWLGWFEDQMGEIEAGRKHLLEAERMLRAAGLVDSFEYGVVEQAFGVQAAIRGDWGDAEVHFRRRETTFEHLRRLMPAGRSRNALTPRGPAAMTLIHLRRQNYDDAWRSLVRSEQKNSSEDDALSRWRDNDPAGFKRVQTLREARSKLPHLELLADEMNWASIVEVIRLGTAIFTLEADYLNRATESEVSVAEIQEVLQADEAYLGWIEFSFGNEHLRWKKRTSNPKSLTSRWLFAIKQNGIRWYEQASRNSPDEVTTLHGRLNHQANRLRTAASWPTLVDVDPLVEREAQQLGEELLGSALPDLKGVDHLITQVSYWIPKLPVESLRLTDGSWLSERFSTTYVMSPAQFVASVRDRPMGRGPLEILLVGGAGDSPELPYAAAEIEGIERSMTRRGSVSTRHAPGDLRGAAKRSDVIHFAGHFKSDPIRGRSGFILSGGRVPEVVEANKVMDAWELDAELVTLSGCGSFDLRLVPARSFHLTESLLRSGAKRVVGSFFDVDDRAASLFMQHFYEGLFPIGGGVRSPREALRDARNWMREYRDEDGKQLYAHPGYWAGYSLFGAR